MGIKAGKESSHLTLQRTDFPALSQLSKTEVVSEQQQLKLGNGIFRRGTGWLPLLCHQEMYLQNQHSPLSETEVRAEFPLLFFFTWLNHHA